MLHTLTFLVSLSDMLDVSPALITPLPLDGSAQFQTTCDEVLTHCTFLIDLAGFHDAVLC